MSRLAESHHPPFFPLPRMTSYTRCSILLLLFLGLCFAPSHQRTLEKREIEGSAYLYEFAYGPALDPDVSHDIPQIIQTKGYPCETHELTTSDGYILTTYRIPHGRKGPSTGPPVILFHGLLDSSFTWLVNFPGQSLPYLLADAGYDVWLPNCRGNRYSLKHKVYNPNEVAFWAFSFDQIGLIDLPTNVDYILEKTGYNQTYYVGHSQGTTIGFLGFSSNRDLASKIRVFGALAPVTMVNHVASLLFSNLKLFPASLLWEYFGHKEMTKEAVLNDKTLLGKIITRLCDLTPQSCEFIIGLMAGPLEANLNASRVSVIVSHEDGGTSTQNLMHWYQNANDEYFSHYDWGSSSANQKHYGTSTPPRYNISEKFPKSLPVAFFSGGKDQLATPPDTKKLLASLPTPPVLHQDIKSFGHMDFVWSLEATEIVYAPLLDLFKKYPLSK